MSKLRIGFGCDKCDAQFANGRDLDIHLRQIHSELRPFLCHLCPAKFKEPHDLEHHVETCKGVKKEKAQEQPVKTSLTNAITVTIPTTNPMTIASKMPPNAKVIQVSDENLMNTLLKQGATKTVVSKAMLDKLIAGGKIVNKTVNEKSGSGLKTIQRILKPKDASTATPSKENTISSQIVASTIYTGGSSSLGAVTSPTFCPSAILKSSTTLTASTAFKPVFAETTSTIRASSTPTTTTTSSTTTTSNVGNEVILQTLVKNEGSISFGANSTASASKTSDWISPVKTEAPLQPFSCSADSCGLKLSSVSELRAHVTIEHIYDVLIRCDLCDMTFPQVTDLEEHVKSIVCPVNADGKWKRFGTMPSVPAGSIDILDPTLSRTHAHLPNVSDLPGLKFCSKPSHKPRPKSKCLPPIKSEPLSSDTDHEFDDLDPEALKDQQKQNKQHVCNVCSKTYSTLNSFTKHYRKHARGDLMPPKNEARPTLKYPCNMCSKSFHSFEELFNHRKVHTGETPYACRYCDQAYVNVDGLQHHMFGVHAWCMNAIKLIRCRIVKKCVKGQKPCFGRFFHMKGLQQHFQIVHQTEMQFPCSCERCCRDFACAEQLEEHIRSRECDIGVKITEWLSETPDAEYGISSALSTTTVQTAERPAQYLFPKIKNSQQTRGRQRVLRVQIERNPKCPRCRKRFDSVAYLGWHYSNRCVSRPPQAYWRKKTRDRKRCDTCDLVFWSLDSYAQHMNLHETGLDDPNTRKTMKECSLCFKVFSDIGAFFEHYKSHGARNKNKRKGRMNGSATDADNSEAVEDEQPSVAETDNDELEPPCKKPSLVWNLEEKSLKEGKEGTKTSDDSRKMNFVKTCSVCSRMFTNINDFIEHYRSHQSGDERKLGQKYVCARCGSQFISRQVYLNHMKIHTGETPYTCKFCPEAFASERNLGLHIPAAHLRTKFFRLNEPRTPTTAATMKSITSIYEIKLTIGSGSGKHWSCKCLECEESFKSYKNLKEHILSEKCPVTYKPVAIDTREGVIMSLFCKICSNMYDNEENLEKHMKTNHLL